MSGLRRRHWRGREGGAARGAVRSLRGGHGGRKGRGFRRKWSGRRVECGFIRAEGAGLKAEVGGGKEAGFWLEWSEWAGLKAEVEFKGERGGAFTGSWVVTVEGGAAKAGSFWIYE